MSALISLERAVLGRRLHEEVNHGVVPGVVVGVSDVFSVTFPHFTGFNHLSSGRVTLSPALNLLRFAVVFGLRLLSRLSSHVTTEA